MYYEKLKGAKWIAPIEFADQKQQNTLHREHERFELFMPDEMKNLHFTVKKTFAAKKEGRVTLRITGNDYYKAYINGKFAGQGPCQGYNFHYYWNEFDVTDLIEDGENEITVNAYYHGYGCHAYMSGDRVAGVLAAIFDEKSVLAVTDKTWECSLMPEFTSRKTGGYDTFFYEDIDNTLKIRSYKPALEREDYDIKLSDEPAKALSVYSVKPKVTEKLSGGYVFYDFGSEITGTVKFTCTGKKGCKVTVYTGEETEDSAIKTRWRMRCNADCEEIFTMGADVDTYEQYDYKGFRYVTLKPDDGVKITEFEVIARHYPFDDDYAELDSDDKILKEVWRICKNGVKYGSQEIFVDCPTREKGQYSGDMTVTSGAHLILTGDTSLTKKAIDNIMQSAVIDDGLLAVAPGGMQEIADYSLQFPIWAIRLYKFSGDKEYLAKCLDACEGIERHFKKYARQDGLLDGVSDKWNLVDWPDSLRDGYDFKMSKPIGPGCHNVINAFWVGFVKGLDEMRELLGIAPKKDYVKLTEAFNREFYKPEKKLYTDTKASTHSALHSNILPFYYGLCPDEAIEPIKDFMMEKKLCCGVYMSFFFMKGLLRYGFRDEVYKILTLTDEHSWYNMVREGATTCFEAWGKEQKNNCSLCHPWASAPIEIMYDLGLVKRGGARVARK